MKVRWYLFFLTLLTVSFISINIFSIEKEVPTKIGVLMVGEERHEKYMGLQEGLVELGYLEEDFRFTVKDANDNPSLLKKKIDELLEEQPDVIVTLGSIETSELKKVIEERHLDIPVIFAGIASPKETGIIDDYRSPGGNITGINNDHTSLSSKRLEMFHDLVPSIERVLVLYDQNVEVSRLSLERTMEAGKLLAIHTVPFNVASPNFISILDDYIQKEDALFILPSFRTEGLINEIVGVSKKHKIPVMGLFEHEVESGYLASYGTSFYDQGYQAARFVSSILQGNSPSQLPVELPDTVRFLVNREVLEELGLKMNPELMYIAEFIQEGEKGDE